MTTIDNREHYPKATKLAEWAIKNSNSVTEDPCEYEGINYKSVTSVFQGNLGKRVAQIRDELGGPGSYTLINNELEQLRIKIGGDGMQSNYGQVLVAHTLFTPLEQADELAGAQQLDTDILDTTEGMTPYQLAAVCSLAQTSTQSNNISILITRAVFPDGAPDILYSLTIDGDGSQHWHVITKQGKLHKLNMLQVADLKAKFRGLVDEVSVFDSVGYVLRDHAQSSIQPAGASMGA